MPLGYWILLGLFIAGVYFAIIDAEDDDSNDTDQNWRDEL